MQTNRIEPIENRIVALLKESPSINGTRISNLLDEDEVVVKNKLTMLVKDGVLFSEPGILEPCYHVSPLRTGWVIPTFREIGQVTEATQTAKMMSDDLDSIIAVPKKAAEVVEPAVVAPTVPVEPVVAAEATEAVEPAETAPNLVTNYSPKVERAIAFLKSKQGNVALSRELSKAMGLTKGNFVSDVLKYACNRGDILHRGQFYWLPTESKVATEPAPRAVKLKQCDPVSLPATIPQPRRVFGEAQPDKPESNYKEWLAQRGQDSHTAAAKPKATEVASAPTAAAIETEAPKHDPIHNPSHYTNGGIEFIEVLRAKLSSDEFRGFLKGNVIKYTLRAEHKDGAQDYAKGARYAQWLAEVKPSPRAQSKPLLIIPNVDLRELRKSVTDGYKASNATMLDLIDFAIQHHQPT